MADEHETARLERMVAIACDHGGFALKQALKVALPDVTWLDLGTMPSGTAGPGAAF